MRRLNQNLTFTISEFVKTVTRPYPPFYTSIIFEGYRSSAIWQSFLGFSYSLQDLIVVEGLWYYPGYHMVDFAKRITDELFSTFGEKFFERIKQETARREKTLIEAVGKDFESFVEAYAYYMPTLGIYFICDDLIEKRVTELLMEKESEKETEEMMRFLTLPAEDNFNKKAERELLESRNVDEYLKNYGWMRSRYGVIQPYPREEAENLLKSLEKSDFTGKYVAEKRDIESAVQKAKRAFGEEKQYLIDLIQFFIYQRTQRTDVMAMVSYRYAAALEEIAREKGLSYTDFLYSTHQELDSTLPNKETIEQRKYLHSFVGRDGEYSIYTGEENEKIKRSFEVVSESAKRVEGRVAYRGRVPGKVKVIKDLQDLSKIQEGDILVTSMTTPVMVPVMKKAAAFVTDEGGITCHAAIIAREMKKPCIIGTKTATSILKDDDLVEVDAENGVVRILKRAENR